jgi:glycerol-3-phosphate cytidylyltransferase
MIDIDAILENFKNWEFSKENSGRIIFECSLDESAMKKMEFMNHIGKQVALSEFSVLLNQNKITLKPTKKSKYRRMYTSGCFDIFHYGHLNILEKSKELCDYLIVGVSTDELIEKEKGKKPVIPFEERLRVVKAIGVVDEVIPQEDKNKQKIVDQYHIDAISVGDDWRGRYPKVSCAMEYFAYTPNVSSTILKKALRLAESSL